MPHRISQIEELDILSKTDSFSVIADCMPDVIALFDRQFRHLFVNKVIETITFKPREHFIGKSNRDIGMPKELCDLWESQLTRCFETQENIDFEFTYNGPNEKQVFHCLGCPRSISNNKVESVILISRDVTKLKDQQNHMLRAASLSSANHLCAEAAHHLNNPLAIVKGNLALLRKHGLTISDPKTEKYLNTMEVNVERMSHIIQTLAKITSDANDNSFRDHDFILQDAIQLAIFLVQQKFPKLKFEINNDSEEPQKINGRFSDLTEALTELFKNSCEAVTSNQDPNIFVRTIKNKDSIMISIIDNGTLPELKDPHQIFLPFFSTKGPQAKGFGLNIATENVRRLGGQLLWDESAENTTFKIKLPLRKH